MAEREKLTRDIDQSIAELRIIAARHANGSTGPVHSLQGASKSKRNRRSNDSYIALSLDVLQKHRQPLHVEEIAKRVAELKNAKPGEVTRASVEGALVRAIKQHYGGVKRTAPSTFAVENKMN